VPARRRGRCPARHRLEQLDVLERARDPAPHDPVHRRLQERLPVEEDVALVRRVEPRDHVERGRLAGAVRPDQADDLALRHVERDPVEGNDPAEPASHVPQREQGHRPEELIRVERQMAKRTRRRPDGGYSPRVTEISAELHMSRGQKITNLLGVTIPFAGFLASIFFSGAST
jgi:hypothetical protein